MNLPTSALSTRAVLCKRFQPVLNPALITLPQQRSGSCFVAMSFEEMLRTLVKLPQNYLVEKPTELRLKVMGEESKGKCDILTSVDDKAKEETFEKVKQDEIRLFDQHLKIIKMPSMLLERLKREFDESHNISERLGKPTVKPSPRK